MKSLTSFGLVVIMALLSCVVARADDTERTATGAHLYQVSCSGCHGRDGRGDGPVSPYLTIDVPDLTRIAARRAGEFPDEAIFKIIDGQDDLRSHGPLTAHAVPMLRLRGTVVSRVHMRSPPRCQYY